MTGTTPGRQHFRHKRLTSHDVSWAALYVSSYILRASNSVGRLPDRARPSRSTCRRSELARHWSDAWGSNISASNGVTMPASKSTRPA